LVYIEWGSKNFAFGFEIEWEIIKLLAIDPIQLIHPILLPLLMSQVILLTKFFRKNLPKIFFNSAFIFLTLLVIFILTIGVLKLNWKIISSTIPYLILSYFILKKQIKKNDP
jgi:hypothetical protein